MGGGGTKAAIVAVACLAFTGAAGSASTPETAVIVGTAAVIDGDGLRVAGADIRLFGIDAFERRQQCRAADGTRWDCGAAATATLRALAEGRTVVCRPRDRDRWRRPVAICWTGDVEINRQMVRAGFALAYRRFSGRYAADEDAARSAKAGAWRGSFSAPWMWRRAHPGR